MLNQEIKRKIIKKEYIDLFPSYVFFAMIPIGLFMGLRTPLSFLLYILIFVTGLIISIQSLQFIVNLKSEQYTLKDCELIRVYTKGSGRHMLTIATIVDNGMEFDVQVPQFNAKYFRKEQKVLLIKTLNKNCVYSYKYLCVDGFSQVK